MPRYFGQKGHNKQTWQFQKTHPQLRIFTEGGESPHVIFRPIGPVSPKTATDESKSSGGDSVSVLGANGPSNSSTSIHIKK